MILGVGVDLCAVARVEKSIQKPSFCRHVYAPTEQTLLESLSGKRRGETAAANFAAKEAFLKAVGTGLGGFDLSELAVLRRESGAPYFALSGRAAAWAEQNGVKTHLSLSHESGLATALVVLEQEVRP